jgi:hypothetical protein
MFFLAGLLFPLVLVVGDGCYGVENAGYQVVKGQTSLCADIGGTPQGTNCLFEQTFSDINVSTSIDLIATYAAVVGTRCSVTNDPLRPFWLGVKNSVASLPDRAVDRLVEELKAQIELRPALITVIQNTAQSVGANFVQFVGDLGDELGCTNLHEAIVPVKGAVCCDLLTAVYWALGSWYLLSWTYLCCGCGASILARKRFTQLWGKEYEDAMFRLQQTGGFSRNLSEEPNYGSIDVKDVMVGVAVPLEMDPISTSYQTGDLPSDQY